MFIILQILGRNIQNYSISRMDNGLKKIKNTKKYWWCFRTRVFELYFFKCL